MRTMGMMMNMRQRKHAFNRYHVVKTFRITQEMSDQIRSFGYDIADTISRALCNAYNGRKRRNFKSYIPGKRT